MNLNTTAKSTLYRPILCYSHNGRNALAQRPKCGFSGDVRAATFTIGRCQPTFYMSSRPNPGRWQGEFYLIVHSGGARKIVQPPLNVIWCCCAVPPPCQRDTLPTVCIGVGPEKLSAVAALQQGGLLWAHGLHLLFFPVWPVYSIDVCLDRLPSIPEKKKKLRVSKRGLCIAQGRLWSVADSRDRSSLIFSGFPNSVVSVRLTGGVV